MDKKYISKIVALPIEAHQKLEAARLIISKEIGVKLSLSQTIQYLCTEVLKVNEENEKIEELEDKIAKMETDQSIEQLEEEGRKVMR